MVEIIPKKSIAKLPSSQNIFFYLVALVIFLVILGYFFVEFYMIAGAERRLENVEDALEKTKTEEHARLEKELSDYEKKIEYFSILLNRHVFFSRTFNFIEDNTHPDVWFSEFRLIPGEGEIRLSGQTDNFVNLHQQVRILKDNNSVKNLNLSKIAIGREGRVNFDLGLTLDLGLLK